MLSEHNFDLIYSTGESEPSKFFDVAFKNSLKFDLALGYFSSSAFRVLAHGFASFIYNGGKMRMIMNNYLSKEDKDAFNIGIVNLPTDLFEENFISSLMNLKNVLSKKDRHFFKCLSWLISDKRLEFKVVVPNGEAGIVHQKFGIFEDIDGNELAFNGSANFAANALLNNVETVDCFPSWENESENKRIRYYKDRFEGFWSGSNSRIKIITLERVKEVIREEFYVEDVEEIMIEAEDINKALYSAESTVSYKALTPKFPFDSGPREYQVEAYINWVANNYQGIFAMATGTGKTITSLNCALEEYKKNDEYYIIVIVPTLTLISQWEKELKKFRFQNIYKISGENNWRSELTRLKNKTKHGINENFVLLSTYISFSNETAIKLISELDQILESKIILIADEAHNIGAQQTKRAFEKIRIKKRIALSATPKRVYDIEGTKDIERLFNDMPPYCYNFSLKKAIEYGFLSEYDYFPILVELNDDEFENYIRLTKVILRYYDSTSNSFKRNPELERLLLKRKRIIHKAENKKKSFLDIISRIGESNIKYTFVYAPEGESEISDLMIIEEMQQLLKSNYPSIKFNLITGEQSLNERAEILRGFIDGRIDLLFAKKILDEGVDIPRTEIGIFSSSTGNPRQFIQRRGRLLRKHPEKRKALIYDMIVIPINNGIELKSDYYKYEKSIVRNELTRVAYFASLARNFYNIRESLTYITDYYNLSIDTLINELSDE